MAAGPGRRSMVAVSGLGGQWRHRRERRGAGRWCGVCGGEAGDRKWPEMVHVEAVPGW
jgi:hypothetical protein